jgi:hypothetical protein
MSPNFFCAKQIEIFSKNKICSLASSLSLSLSLSHTHMILRSHPHIPQSFSASDSWSKKVRVRKISKTKKLNKISAQFDVAQRNIVATERDRERALKSVRRSSRKKSPFERILQSMSVSLSLSLSYQYSSPWDWQYKGSYKTKRRARAR